MKKEDYIWYCSYGSNLSLDRFMCYIIGGKPKNSSKEEEGCRDKTPPKDDRPHRIKHALYFARHSKKWNNGGSCILSVKHDENKTTLGRKFLITVDQFLDIVSQNNGVEQTHIDFDEVIKHGSKSINDTLSGNILYLGDEDGYPIFTFTSHFDETEFVKPDILYLATIGAGVKETFKISTEEVADYFMELDGIKQNYTKNDLQKQLEKLI
ncbi:MAG: hypothetical protein JXL97_11490 [Bacteroidales bacterium]|nr:hypothetical protein [Bacteroidales bacterium]